MNKENLLKTINEIINDIPTPPPGRKIALVKTKLEEARLWLQDDINDEKENDWNVIENALTGASKNINNENELPAESFNKLLALGYTAKEIKELYGFLLI